MDYGTRWKHVMQAALAGLGFSVVVTALWVVGVAREGWSNRHWLLLPLCLFWFPLLFALAVGLFALFRVRVKAGKVERVFGPVVVQSRSLAKCVSADGHVTFDDGKRWVIQSDEQERMELDLVVAAHEAKQAELAGCNTPPGAVTVAPQWLSWQNGTVKNVARTLARERKFDQFGVLADALEDAGCTDEVLLSHLRLPVRHVCGCWALALFASQRRSGG